MAQIYEISCYASLRNSAPTLRNSVLFFLFITFLFPWQSVLAHGGGELQISNAPIGEYQVSVWNNPPTAQAGQAVHITVGIARAENGEPVLDAAVFATIVNEGGEVLTTAAATTEQSINRLFYEADLDGVPAGAYEMQIRVTGSAGSGTLAFPLTVAPVSPWPWLVGGVAAVAIVWLVLHLWRKGANKTAPARRTTRNAPAETAVPRRRSVD